MTLEQYLKKNCEAGLIDHAVRAEIRLDGQPRFYIHPAGANGDTLDFVVTQNQLHPAYVWDGMEQLAAANPIPADIRAKMDAHRSADEGGRVGECIFSPPRRIIEVVVSGTPVKIDVQEYTPPSVIRLTALLATNRSTENLDSWEMRDFAGNLLFDSPFNSTPVPGTVFLGLKAGVGA